MAREGLVPLMDKEGEIRYKHIDELLPADAAGRIRADTALCDWLVWRTEQRSEWLEAWRRRSG